MKTMTMMMNDGDDDGDGDGDGISRPHCDGNADRNINAME